MFIGFNVNPRALDHLSQQPCEACIMGKSKRAPFPTSDSSTPRLLQIMAFDTTGKLTKGINGERYAVAGLDIYSGYAKLETLRRKSHAVDAVKRMVLEAQRETELMVEIIRTDNGTEYLNNELTDWLQSQGIKHQLTVSHNPEQNGAVERLWGTLFDWTRSTLLDEGLPQALWPYALQHVNYVRNRLPRADGTPSPYQLYWHSVPDISNLRVFGCRAWAHLPKEVRGPSSKLDARAVPAIFIGFEPNVKAWRLLSEDGTAFVSRDVKFDEARRADKSCSVKIVLRSAGEERDGESDSESEGSGDDGAAASDDEDWSPPHAVERSSAFKPSPAERGGAAAAKDPDHTTQTTPPTQPAPRRPERERRPPTWHSNYLYIGATAPAGLRPPDPNTYEEAMRQDPAKWRPPFQAEIDNLLANQTLDFSNKPGLNDVVVDVKMIGKSKYDAFGNWEKDKGRLVAKGYQQPNWVESFAPTSASATTRTVLGLVAAQDWELHQLDITGAFLNASLPPGTWVRLPPWVNEYLPAEYRNPSGGPVLAHLNKALYGLKEAPRAWHQTLAAALEKLGYANSPADAALFVRVSADGKRTWLLVYVDDVLVASELLEDVQAAKAEILGVFKGIDKGEASSFLGMTLQRERLRRLIMLGQEKFTKNLIEQYGVSSSHPKLVPIAEGAILTEQGTPLDTNTYKYNALIGSLNYLAVSTRPDLSFAMRALSRFQANPTTDHWDHALGILRYLNGTSHLKLHLGGDNFNLLGYSDADWGGEKDSRLSTTGWIYLLGNAAISWSSKRQELVATSTAEAEYTALATSAREALWLRYLLESLGFPLKSVPIKADSTSAIAIAKDPIVTARNKHYDVKLHFIRQRVKRGELSLVQVPSKDNLADPLTKPVTKVILEAARAAWGLQ